MEKRSEKNKQHTNQLSSLARQLLNLAIKNVSQNLNQNVNCLDLLNRAIAEDPKLAEFSVYYFYLGTALSNESKYRESIYFLQRALEINTGWENVDSALTNYKIGSAYEKLNDLDRAIKCYERASLLNSSYFNKLNELKKIVDYQNNLNDLIQTADEALVIKDYHKAKDLYQEILKICDLNSTYWFNLGLSNYYLGEYHQAIKVFSKSINIDKNWSSNNILDAWHLLSLSYYFLGQRKRSLSKCDRALSIDSNYIKAREIIEAIDENNSRKQEAYNLASSGFEFLQTDNKQAISNFKKAVELDTSVSRYWYGLGVSWIESQEYARGIEAIENALCLNNKWGRIKLADAWYYLGLATEYLGNLDLAFIYYSKARSISQNKHRLAISKYEKLYLERISQGKKHNSIKNISINFNKEIDDILRIKCSSQWLEEILAEERKIDLLTGVISLLSQLENNRDCAAIVSRGFFKEEWIKESFWIDLALSLTSIIYSVGNVVNYLASNVIFKDDLTIDYRNKELANYASQLEIELRIDNLQDAIESCWSTEVEMIINYWQRCLWELLKWIEQITLDNLKQNLLKRYKKLSDRTDSMLLSAFETIKFEIDEVLRSN